MKYDLNYYLELLQKSQTPVVGIGVTAFNRIGPAWIYPNYQIVCYKGSDDVGEIHKLCPVKTIQDDFSDDGDLSSLNSLAILQHKGVVRFLNGFGQKPMVFVYRSSENIEKECQKMGLSILSNNHEIRDLYENKEEFFRIGREIGLPMITGEQWLIDEVSDDAYEQLKIKFGEKLVFQLSEIFKGGGVGTFFINNQNDLAEFRAEVEKARKERELSKVNVTKFMNGVSSSITGCVTKHGTLTGPVQTQVVDVPELLADKTRQGVFRGHDWSFVHYGQEIQKEADGLAQKLGEHMRKAGYKGIFGIDLIVDLEDQKVYPVECNPRYTGAFPVYSMLQKSSGEVPLDVFQFLEFLNIDYEMDFDEINNSWKQPKEGAHLVLHNLDRGNWVRVDGDVRAGVYRLNSDGLEWVRSRVTYGELENDDEFVLTDGLPKKGQLVKPGLRYGKIIFKRGVLEKPGVLNDFAREVVRVVEKGMMFEVVEGL